VAWYRDNRPWWEALQQRAAFDRATV
jgi:hypothetical protein